MPRPTAPRVDNRRQPNINQGEGTWLVTFSRRLVVAPRSRICAKQHVVVVRITASIAENLAMTDPLALVPKPSLSNSDPRLLSHRAKFGLDHSPHHVGLELVGRGGGGGGGHGGGGHGGFGGFGHGGWGHGGWGHGGWGRRGGWGGWGGGWWGYPWGWGWGYDPCFAYPWLCSSGNPWQGPWGNLPWGYLDGGYYEGNDDFIYGGAPWSPWSFY